MELSSDVISNFGYIKPVLQNIDQISRYLAIPRYLLDIFGAPVCRTRKPLRGVANPIDIMKFVKIRNNSKTIL